MEEPKLWLVCLNAFVAVLGLLSLLACAMRLLITLFPVKKIINPDAVVHAAIAKAVDHICPGATVSRIEEIR